ncbi:MAG: spherulation-specific family 4 protein [Planctomycetota bacterium]
MKPRKNGLGLTTTAIFFAPLAGLGISSAAADELGLIVPAYFYPGGTGLGYWNDLNDAAQDVPILAIMNPGSGPGNGIDPNYTAAVDSLRSAGGMVIGYVSTAYTDRSLSSVQSDIDDYVNWYNLDGIFLDEFTNTNNAADLAYYESLYGYIKNINADWTVVGNPGTRTVEPYASRPTADILVVFESFASNYQSYTPATWNDAYPSGRLAHLVHTESTVDGMLDALDQGVAQNAGWHYITDDVLNNPWDRLPTYWDQQVARVQEINGQTPVDPGPGVKPGGVELRYNPVPNGSIDVGDGSGDRTGWVGVEAYSVDPAGDAGPQVDFVGLAIAHDDDEVFFRVERDAGAANPLDFNQNVFIDADQDRATGFTGGGGFLPIGVDYLLQGGTLYSFANGSNQEVWGWNSLSSVNFDGTPSTDVELAVARASLGDPIAIDFVLNAANTGSGSAEDYYPNAGNLTDGEYFTYAFVATAQGLVGDYNGSGAVEQGDLNLVLNNWGVETTGNVPAGWINDLPEGAVDQAELNRVLNNWGASSAPNLASLPIPEPASMLALSALTSVALRRRHA